MFTDLVIPWYAFGTCVLNILCWRIDSINLTKLRDPILFVFSASQATYERIFFGCARIPPAKMLSLPITHSVTSTGDDWETVVINSQTDER